MPWLVILLLLEPAWRYRTASDLVAEYKKRLCTNEPTCSLANHPSIPRVFRTLEKRNCMCDADCREYKDCCIDSPFYRIRDQLPPFSYYCSPSKKVYMKVRCLAEWSDATMVSKCQKSILPLEDDLSVITPLTNVVTGVTYGNVYCAVCNNAFTAESAPDFFTWNLSVRCGELPPQPTATPTPTPTLAPSPSPPADWRTPLLVQVPRFIPLDGDFETTLKQLYPSLRNARLPATGYYLLVLLLYHVHPAAAAAAAAVTASVRAVRDLRQPPPPPADRHHHHRRRLPPVDFEAHAGQWDAIALNASYDANARLWLSGHRGKTFVCEYESRLPVAQAQTETETETEAEAEAEGAGVPLRACVPNVIAECSRFENAVLVHECRLRTAVVLDERGLAYRNKACAQCNGVREERLFVCPRSGDDDHHHRRRRRRRCRSVDQSS